MAVMGLKSLLGIEGSYLQMNSPVSDKLPSAYSLLPCSHMHKCVRLNIASLPWMYCQCFLILAGAELLFQCPCACLPAFGISPMYLQYVDPASIHYQSFI